MILGGNPGWQTMTVMNIKLTCQGLDAECRLICQKWPLETAVVSRTMDLLFRWFSVFLRWLPINRHLGEYMFLLVISILCKFKKMRWKRGTIKNISWWGFFEGPVFFSHAQKINARISIDSTWLCSSKVKIASLHPARHTWKLKKAKLEMETPLKIIDSWVPCQL